MTTVAAYRSRLTIGIQKIIYYLGYTLKPPIRRFGKKYFENLREKVSIDEVESVFLELHNRP